MAMTQTADEFKGLFKVGDEFWHMGYLVGTGPLPICGPYVIDLFYNRNGLPGIGYWDSDIYRDGYVTDFHYGVKACFDDFSEAQAYYEAELKRWETDAALQAILTEEQASVRRELGPRL